MPKNIIKRISITTLSLLTLIPSVVGAVSAFDPHYIISDYDMRNNSSWSVNDVQKFLESKGSYLSSYTDIDIVDQKPKFASGIIYDAASRYNINPKVLLVTLQKEQSLITDKDPDNIQLDWATGYAVCDSCSINDPKVIKHKGFATQIDDTAFTFDWYLDNQGNSSMKNAGV